MANGTMIQNAAQNKPADAQAKQSLNAMINSLLDKEGMRKRFDELLGKRTPQFMSSLVSLMNASPQLQEAFYQSPMTVIQSALKAATYDLPIDPALGFAYIVPFNNKKKVGNDWVKVPEATFIMGYKGMRQLALRTGAYKRGPSVTDVREGELRHYDRLTEDIDIEWIADEDIRESTKIAGYVGYFRLVNGTEKTIYMSVNQIEAHEKKHRKGNYRGKGWNDDFEAMCEKTVLRKLIGKYGLMSIDYMQADAQTVAAAEAIAAGHFDDEDTPPDIVIGDMPNIEQGEEIPDDEPDIIPDDSEQQSLNE